MAINPTNGNEVFVGTGDPNYAVVSGPSGNGIWQSTSTGDPTSWVKVSPSSLDGETIYRLRIDPAPPNNIYAADLLPSIRRKVCMILRNEEERHGEGKAQ